MEAEISRLRSTGRFEEIRSSLTGFKMSTMTFGFGDTGYVYDESANLVEITEYDISHQF